MLLGEGVPTPVQDCVLPGEGVPWVGGASSGPAKKKKEGKPHFRATHSFPEDEPHLLNMILSIPLLTSSAFLRSALSDYPAAISL